MLRIYLNKRLVKLETDNLVEDNLQKGTKCPFRFTGKKVFLIELGYSLVSSGDINNGNVEIKEIMNFLGTVFQVELGDYYAAYIAMKERKKDRTAYLTRLQDCLIKRMDKDDSKQYFLLFASNYVLAINKPFSISINIEWFIVFIQYCHIEILLSINQAINISIKQDCRITKINSSVGERPAARGGTTRPDERKNL